MNMCRHILIFADISKEMMVSNTRDKLSIQSDVMKPKNKQDMYLFRTISRMSCKHNHAVSLCLIAVFAIFADTQIHDCF